MMGNVLDLLEDCKVSDVDGFGVMLLLVDIKVADLLYGKMELARLLRLLPGTDTDRRSRGIGYTRDKWT